MPEFHEMSCTPYPAGMVFECLEGCGRRLVVERETRKLTIIDRGDQFARHRGSHSDLEMSGPNVA
jgi:hypothetical protein